VRWNGRLDGAIAQAGGHELAVAGRDPAGNVGPKTRPVQVVLRYVALGRKRIVVTAGARFAVLVSADARRIEWKLGARTGTARPGTLRLRAPLVPSRYTLTVRADDHSARAAVIVRAAAP
jgi:hypothetical protein